MAETSLPAFAVSDRLRNRLRKGESRATVATQLNINPLNLNTEAVPGGTPVFKRYVDEVVLDGATALFRFEQLTGDRFRDSIRTSNYTETVGDITALQPGLLSPPGLESPGYSVVVNDATAIVGAFEDEIWPAVYEFWFETEDIGPADFLLVESAVGSSVSGSVLFTLNVDGTITVASRDDSDVVLRSQDTTMDTTDGVARHVVYRDTGTVCSLFVNGVEQ